MNEKTVSLALVALVVMVGIIGIVNLKQETTGAAMLENRYCCCALTTHNFYGGSSATEIQKVRIRSWEKWTDAGCDNVCDSMFTPRSGKYREVTGTACQ